jgi:hypothetical protein
MLTLLVNVSYVSEEKRRKKKRKKRRKCRAQGRREEGRKDSRKTPTVIIIIIHLAFIREHALKRLEALAPDHSRHATEALAAHTRPLPLLRDDRLGEGPVVVVERVECWR